MGTNFNMRSVRVHTRGRSERELPVDLIPNVIQSELVRAIVGSTEITRDVIIGAMYTDDLPIGGHRYSNIFIVIGWGMEIDIPLPRDAHVIVELYFGWRQSGINIRIADDWYLDVGVSNVGPLRRRLVEDKVRKALTVSDSGPTAGVRIRDGIGAIFNQSGVRDWYIVPGTGRHNSQNNIEVRRNASFWVVR